VGQAKKPAPPGFLAATTSGDLADNQEEMPRFVLIEAPFHMGLEDIAVGRGPARFLRAGADNALASNGEPAQVVHVRKRDGTTEGLDAVVDINRQIRTAAREAIAEGGCPVVLAGNCNSCLGTLGGIEAERVGIVWLDAHGDFNTPATSLSGMLDGMALAAAVGHCHDELRERIGMERPIDANSVLLLGWRDLDPAEPGRLLDAGVVTRAAFDLDGAEALLAGLRARADAVYVHIDVDFLDPAESPGANFRSPGGVPLARAEELTAAIARELPVAAIGLSNYNPEFDPAGLTGTAGVRLLRAMASAFPFPGPR
jgi:arginase